MATELMLVNPKKRRAKRKAVSTVRRRSPRRRSPRRAMATYRKRTRRAVAKTNIVGQVQSAAVGAGGALAVDVIMARLPIPENLKSGPMRPAVQGAVSVALGMAVKKFGKKAALGRQLAEGGLTVALHGVAKNAIGPKLGLAGFDDELLGFDDELLGYESFDDDSGWVSPAPVGSMEAYDSSFDFEEDYA